MFFCNTNNFRRHKFKLGGIHFNNDNSIIQDKFNYNMFFYRLPGSKYYFHRSPITVSNSNLKLIIDNSKNKFIINRESGLYKVYENLYLNDIHQMQSHLSFLKSKDNFIDNLTNVLEDLYDNNEFTIFQLYFIIKPHDRNYKLNLEKLIKHLSKYPIEFIMDDENITKFYKNIGLIFANSVLVFTSTYDIDNLSKISKDIKLSINNSIKVINENVYKDLNNTIINFDTKVNIDYEIMLIITADFDSMDSDFNNFNSMINKKNV